MQTTSELSSNGTSPDYTVAMVRRSAAGAGSRASATTMTTCQWSVAAANLVRGRWGRRHLLSFVALLAAATLLLSLCLAPVPAAEAKTHHSKRQAPDQANQQQQQQSGRENTNWWNLWWQQYISEAMQPRVRPITGVSFNGRTINLDQQQIDSLAPAATSGAPSQTTSAARLQQQQDDLMSDNLDSANLVPAAEAGLSSMELARNEKLRLVASNARQQQSDGQAADKQQQMQMASKSAQQQQVNWQSARPTMIQPVAAMAAKMRQAERQNRQAADFQRQQLDELAPGELGIQMRSNMNRQQQQVAAQREQVINVEMMEPNGFEQQQQNQMVDYTEESEPEMEMGNSAGNTNGGLNNISIDADDRARMPIAGDSSSSSMMAGGDSVPSSRPKPPATAVKPEDDRRTIVEQTNPEGRSTAAAAAMDDMMRTVPAGSVLDPNRKPDAQVVTTQSPIATSSAPSSTTQRKIETSSPEAAAATTKNQQQQTVSQRATSPPRTTTVQVISTTSRPTVKETVTTPAAPATGSSSAADVDLNETPISMTTGGDSDASSSRPTTAAGRVELENGRPATGARPQGSLSSGRPPTVATPPQTTRTAQTSPTVSPTTSTTAAITTTTTTTTAATPITTTIASTSSGSTTAKSSTAAPEQFTTTTKSTGSGTAGGTASNNSNSSTTTTGGGESSEGNATEEDDDEEEGTEQPNLMNAAGDPSDSGESEDSSDDSNEESSTETEQEPTTNAPGGATGREQSQKGNSPAASAATTQQPPSTITDIERLPKGGSSAPTTAQPRPVSRDEPAASGRPAPPPNANLVMLTLDPSVSGATTMDGDTAITMPMDTLRRIMMSQMMATGELDRMRVEQALTTRLPSTTTTTTTGAPPTTTTTGSPAASTSTTARAPSTTTTSSPPVTTGKQQQTVNQNQPMTESPRKKLQPPPTTRQPRPTAARQPTITTTTTMSPLTSETPLRTTMMLNLVDSAAPAEGAVDVDEDSAGREPKIEMINLDLMPIQRMMDSQRTTQAAGGNSMDFPRQQPQQQPAAQSTTTTTTTSAATGGQTQTDMGLIVEPGMRIKPLAGSGSGAGSRTGSSTMSNPANTVYRIMMTSTSSAPTSNSDLPNTSRSQTRRPSSNLPPTSFSARPPVTVSSTTTKSLDRPATSVQQPASSSSTTTTTTTTTTTGARTSPPAPSTTTLQQQQQQQQTQPKNTGTFGSPSSSNSQQQQTTMVTFDLPTATGQPMSVDTNAIEMESTRNQMQPLKPKSRQPITGFADSTSATSSGSTRMSDQFVTTAMPSPTRLASGEDSQQPGASAASTTDSSSGSSTTFSTSTPSTERQPAADAESTDRRTTGSQSPGQVRLNTSQQGEREMELESGGRAKQQFERIRQQQPANAGKRPSPGGSTKTAAFSATKIGKTANMSSTSFIPNKLRSDFGKFNRIVQSSTVAPNAISNPEQSQQQQQQQTPADGEQSRVNLVDVSSPATTTTTPAPNLALSMTQNMAIRQFGGANRMSVLTNQPVPFGRPAARTMQIPSSNQPARSANIRQRVELPSFEYGPSIAVRRPDEPLANGQVPNCTLTGKNFCVLTKDYPMNEVRQAVERSFRSVRIMYEELQTVSDQELHKDDFNTTNNQAASGKFACQTQVEMMRPGWAKDEITKEWMLVVNTDVFPQRVRTESCAQPNTPCEFIAPFYDSTCQQRYSLHRMIAIDPHDPSRSPQVAVFKFPAGCVCRVHPIRKTTTAVQTTTSATSPAPTTIISTSTSKSIRR